MPPALLPSFTQTVRPVYVFYVMRLQIARALVLLSPLCAWGETPSAKLPGTQPDFSSAPLAKVEAYLAPLGRVLLSDTTLEVKLQTAAEFFNGLKTALQRPESYNYPFDSLLTVSRLAPEDDSFRIFTWQVIEADEARTYRYHTYYGIVQRRLPAASDDAQPEILVIPLQDNVDYSFSVENQRLSDVQWLGAIYYKPRGSEHGVLSYNGTVGRINAVNGKIQERDVLYYVVLGYNGHDISSNYKFVDVITFDPDNPKRVYFGAPIFNFNDIGKYRAVFKYSDNAGFNLNLATTVSGLFRRKREMLVFDHLVRPRDSQPHQLWDMGPDGTQDGLYWIDRVNDLRRGFFVYVQDVTVFAPELEGYDPKVVKEQAKRANQSRPK